jgi:CHAD domain-containing protein
VIVAFHPEPFGRIPPSADKIRRLRKSAKAARALLCLAEDAGGDGAARLSRRIRDWSRQLSPLRDATVIPKTAARVVKARKENAAEAARFAAAKLGFRRKPLSWWRERQEEWNELGNAAARYPFRRFSPSDIRSALKRALKRVRQAARRVRPRDAESAHRWRKRIVVLQGEVRAAAPVLDGAADGLDRDLRQIARRLGKAVDCKVLLATLGDKRADRRAGAKVARRLRKGAKRERAKAIRRACRTWRKCRRRIQAALP